MQKAIQAAIIALAIVIATPVTAQDIDVGKEAYDKGDYAAALREWRPLRAPHCRCSLQ